MIWDNITLDNMANNFQNVQVCIQQN